MVKQIKKPQKNDGFTLLELLVVIVIVGIVSAIAAPSWLGFLSKQRMNAARTDLLGILRTAQEDAQRLQQSKYVEFSSTDLTVNVRNHYDPSGVISTTGGMQTKLGNGEVNSDKFNLIAPAPASLLFDADGRIVMDASMPPPIPFSIKITHDDSTAQSCVIVTTILGGFKPANDALCDSFDPDPT